MANYLLSTNIKVFPTAYRGSADPQASLTTEDNLISLGVRGLGMMSFAKAEDSAGYIVFCVGGYWFKAKKTDIVALADTSATSIYANIKIASLTSTVAGVTVPTLVQWGTITGDNYSLDIDTYFKGIYFSDTASTDASFSLLLLTKSGTTWSVPVASILNILSSQVKDSSGNVPISTRFTSNEFVGHLTGDVTGNLTGNVTGNIKGNVTGNVVGNVTGNVTGDLTGAADYAKHIGSGSGTTQHPAIGSKTSTTTLGVTSNSSVGVYVNSDGTVTSTDFQNVYNSAEVDYDEGDVPDTLTLSAYDATVDY
jgi:hypothetical protein